MERELLFKQYLKAKGLRENELMINHLSDFNDFLNERRLIGLEYKTLYGEYFSEKVIEFNKSEGDTLVYGTTSKMVTPFGNKYLKDYLLFNGNLFIKSNGLYINENKLDDKYLSYHFLTHNPYNESMIKNIDLLSYFTLGMFGNKHDSDKKEKINILKNIINLLDNQNYSFNYNEDTNNYYAVLKKTK